jgi:arylsulfatase A-like enzyme
MAGPAFAATPNIVVVLGDDVGWGDLHANNPGSKVPTPNLDLLAQNGMRFTNAHGAAAECAPMRYSALTGNYQWRGRRDWGTWRYYDSSQILPGQKTVGDLLKSVGYNTAFIGKLHMGGNFLAKGSTAITRDPLLVDFSRPFGDGPIAHGFIYSFPLLEGIQAPPYAYFENDRLVGDANLLRQWVAGRYGSSVIGSTGIGMPYWDSSKVGADLTTKALEFITRHKTTYGKTKPFFLYFAATQVHPPHSPPATFLGQPVRGATKMCARQDMVYELDLTVGALIAKLRTEKLLADTVFIFTSDNGGAPDNCGHDASGPDFSGYKGLVQEGGHRVPFVVRWGDGSTFVIPKGTVRNQLLGVHDLPATLATITGAKIGADQARDSFNMLPVWLGQRTDSAPIRDHLIAEARRAAKGVSSLPRFAYYEGTWKLVAEKRSTGFVVLSLFNLATDKAERNDLKAGQATRVAQMFARFKQRYAATRTAPSPT